MRHALEAAACIVTLYVPRFPQKCKEIWRQYLTANAWNHAKMLKRVRKCQDLRGYNFESGPCLIAQFVQGADADVLPTCPFVLASAPPLEAMLLSQLEFEGDCSSTGERQRWESASWGWGVSMIWTCERCKGNILNIQKSKNVYDKRYETKCSKPVLMRMGLFSPGELGQLEHFCRHRCERSCVLDTVGLAWAQYGRWFLSAGTTRLGGEVLRENIHPRRLASMSMWKSVCLNQLLELLDFR